MRGRGIHPFLVAHEVHAQGLELLQSIDEGLGGAGETVVTPDQDDVYPSLPGGVQESSVLLTLLRRAGGVVDELLDDVESPCLGVGPELAELGLGVLSRIVGGDAGVDGCPALMGSHRIFGFGVFLGRWPALAGYQ